MKELIYTNLAGSFVVTYKVDTFDGNLTIMEVMGLTDDLIHEYGLPNQQVKTDYGTMLDLARDNNLTLKVADSNTAPSTVYAATTSTTTTSTSTTSTSTAAPTSTSTSTTTTTTT